MNCDNIFSINRSESELVTIKVSKNIYFNPISSNIDDIDNGLKNGEYKDLPAFTFQCKKECIFNRNQLYSFSYGQYFFTDAKINLCSIIDDEIVEYSVEPYYLIKNT